MEVLLHPVRVVVRIDQTRSKPFFSTDLEDLVLDFEISSRRLKEPNYNLLLLAVGITG